MADQDILSRGQRVHSGAVERGAARARSARIAAAGLLLALVGCTTPGDDAAQDTPSPYGRSAEYAGVTRTTHFVPMRDGVRLAVDVILPANLPPGARVAALLYQGRYWRSVALRGPARLTHDGVARHGQLGPFKTWFAERGYAWIDVDTRGSGASFGFRLWDYAPDEIRDGADLVDWIVAQPWSDGRVAGVGVSYSGAAAELLLANHHPAVKAALPLFCDFDQYQDILAPGGVPHRAWLEGWADFTRRLDLGRLPFDAWWLPLFVRGVRPVAEDRDGALLAAALREHAANFEFTRMQGVVYRDDRPLPEEGGRSPAEREALARADAWLEARFGPDFRALGTDLASPHAFAAEVSASGAPVYAYSGWLDGAYAKAAARRFAALRQPGNKLLLGPWDHALHTVSPRAAHGASRFDHRGELLRFLDDHVRELPTGLAGEAPVHYFTMGAETWRAAEVWPPPATPARWYLAAGGALAETPPAGEGEDRHVPDLAAGSGPASRWAALRGRPIGDPYPDRAERDARLLHYTSPPLARDTEVTGHPVVTLHLASSAEDGAFFVYLEDVAPDGSVAYVTEGMLRALHRRYAPPGDDPLGLPRRSFARADAAPLVPGEVAELSFDLLPTSYVFAAGHAVRVAIAGGDADHFARIPAEGSPSWRVQRSRSAPSSIVLPVVARP
jgi:putative CocE/NonD family hydrolase